MSERRERRHVVNRTKTVTGSIFTVVALGTVVLLSLGVLANERDEVDRDDPIMSLLADDRDVRVKAQLQIANERAAMVAWLTAIIDDPENHRNRPASVIIAMDTLGAIHAVEAVDILIQHIAFPVVRHPKDGYVTERRSSASIPRIPFGGEQDFVEKCAAVKALIAIGDSCVPQVVTTLVETDHAWEVYACHAVLRRLAERPTVRETLEAAARDAADQKRPRLEQLLAEMTENANPQDAR